MTNRVYTPAGPIIQAFHNSKAYFRGVRGPIGSGKTVACCYELLHMAQQQQPSPIDGWRRTRWAVIRNTYRQLELSTIKTWLSKFPENAFGKFRRSPPFRHLIKDRAQKFEMEVYFWALEDETKVDDMLSTEWSGVFINEAREVPKAILDQIDSRIPRFPEMEHGGPTRYGIIADTNAPGCAHWWPILAGDMPPPEYLTEEEARLYVKPDGWEFFTQPPAVHEIKKDGLVMDYAVNRQAENLVNLHPNYYKTKYKGKERDWIQVYLLNRYQDIKAGKPVYPNFNQDVHIFKEPQAINKDRFKNMTYGEVFIGIDFGLTPAAVLMQRSKTGRYRVLQEFVSSDMTIPRFGEWLLRELAALGLEPGDYGAYGDPAGDARDQQGDTAFGLMRAAGMTVYPAATNDPSIRVAAVTSLLERSIHGHPAFHINPTCRFLVAGFIHGYRYRRMRVVGDRYEDKPEKNRYSHVHDALQYAVLGAGEGRKLLGAREGEVVVKSRTERRFDVWGRPRQGGRRARYGIKRW